MAGLEPAREFNSQQILSLSCLPFHHIGISTNNNKSMNFYNIYNIQSIFINVKCYFNHFLIALSLTPYLRPVAEYPNSSISVNNTSYGGLSTFLHHNLGLPLISNL